MTVKLKKYFDVSNTVLPFYNWQREFKKLTFYASFAISNIKISYSKHIKINTFEDNFCTHMSLHYWSQLVAVLKKNLEYAGF